MTTSRRKFLGAVATGAAVTGATSAAFKASAQAQGLPPGTSPGMAPPPGMMPPPGMIPPGMECTPGGSFPAVPPSTPGPIKIPIPGTVAPLKPRVDYEALRQKRIAEVDDETRYINFPDIPPPSRAQPNLGLVPGVTARTIEIDGPTGKMGMRIYMPEKKPPGPIGVYLHTHGGGWAGFKGFDPMQDADNSSYVRDWGCAVIQPDYRVSWDAKFPAAVDDCYAAYRYVLAHASELGVDPKRIGIGGGCAGGNIATVVSIMARDAKIQKPAIQWLWSTVFDTRNNSESYDEFARYRLPTVVARTVTDFYLAKREDAYDWRASPILTPTLKGLSPALIWVGEWEILRDESRQFANRLRDAGVEYTYIEGPKQPHGGIYANNPVTGQPTKYAREAQLEVNRIMRKYIGPK